MVFSRSQLADAAQREAAQEHLNRALAACKCSRTFRPGELLTKPWDEWGSEDFAAIDRCGCRQAVGGGVQLHPAVLVLYEAFRPQHMAARGGR